MKGRLSLSDEAQGGLARPRESKACERGTCGAGPAKRFARPLRPGQRFNPPGRTGHGLNYGRGVPNGNTA